MEFWVGVTDNDWYKFLSQFQPDEVNFWQPSGRPPFKKEIKIFLFKLHSPLNYIAGGGYFMRYSDLPMTIAWDTFQEKNGVSSFQDFKSKIIKYRRSNNKPDVPNPNIGCNILLEPFFFEREDWIPIPEDWKLNIVQGKTYNTETEIGNRLWLQVQENLKKVSSVSSNTLVDSSLDKLRPSGHGYGKSYSMNPRLGQGAFRVLITDIYQRKCAITGEKTLPALEAAHIRSFAENGPHAPNNGILLRADLHRLFDGFYLTVTQNFQIEVSNRIKEEYENGREYYALHGRKLYIPENPKYLPNKEYLEWHNSKFIG